MLSRVNASGEFVYVKYHFLVDTGQKQFNAEEAS
jgi:catalase